MSTHILFDFRKLSLQLRFARGKRFQRHCRRFTPGTSKAVSLLRVASKPMAEVRRGRAGKRCGYEQLCRLACAAPMSSRLSKLSAPSGLNGHARSRRAAQRRTPPLVHGDRWRRQQRLHCTAALKSSFTQHCAYVVVGEIARTTKLACTDVKQLAACSDSRQIDSRIHVLPVMYCHKCTAKIVVQFVLQDVTKGQAQAQVDDQQQACP